MPDFSRMIEDMDEQATDALMDLSSGQVQLDIRDQQKKNWLQRVRQLHQPIFRQFIVDDGHQWLSTLGKLDGPSASASLSQLCKLFNDGDSVFLLFDPDKQDSTQHQAVRMRGKGFAQLVVVRLPEGVDPGEADHGALWELLRLEAEVAHVCWPFSQ